MPTARPPPAPRPLMRAALAGAAALLSGVGLARFAYVPLFPAMVAAGWVGGAEAGMLGAVNFAGYLLGALLAPRLAARLGTRRALDLGMALASLSFLACALALGLAWLVLWRGAAGVAGGLLMSVAGPAVQAAPPPARRAMAGGIAVSGVALGPILAALLVPALLPAGGVAGAWVGLGLVSLLLWAFAHPRWPAPLAAPPQAAGAPGQGAGAPRTPVRRLMLAYGLSAAGMAAPMVYLSDLAARGHGLGVAAGGLVWLGFGAGALAGTLLSGPAADRIGPRRAMAGWMAVQVASLAACLLPWHLALLPASVGAGFAGVGSAAVTLAAVRQAVGPAAPALWSRATSLYAAAQAGTGFALAALFARWAESHAPVFATGLALSLGALAASLWAMGERRGA